MKNKKKMREWRTAFTSSLVIQLHRVEWLMNVFQQQTSCWELVPTIPCWISWEATGLRLRPISLSWEVLVPVGGQLVAVGRQLAPVGLKLVLVGRQLVPVETSWTKRNHLLSHWDQWQTSSIFPPELIDQFVQFQGWKQAKKDANTK